MPNLHLQFGSETRYANQSPSPQEEEETHRRHNGLQSQWTGSCTGGREPADGERGCQPYVRKERHGLT